MSSISDRAPNRGALFALFLLFLVAAMLVSGSIDYADELQAEQAYCSNVLDGRWPDTSPEVDCTRWMEGHRG